MPITERDLLQLKKTIDEAKVKHSEQKGKLSYLMQELERHWECKTVEQAKQRLEGMEEEIRVLDRQIQEGLADLQRRLP